MASGRLKVWPSTSKTKAVYTTTKLQGEGKHLKAMMKELGVKYDKNVGLRGNLERLAEFVNKGSTSGVNETTATYKGTTLVFKSPEQRRLWEYASGNKAQKKEAAEKLESMGVKPDEIKTRASQVKETVLRSTEDIDGVSKVIIGNVFHNRFSKKVAEINGLADVLESKE